MDSYSQNTLNNPQINTELGSSVFEVQNGIEYFSEPTLRSISKLGDVLQRIHKRMIREGYTIECGKIVRNEAD